MNTGLTLKRNTSCDSEVSEHDTDPEDADVIGDAAHPDVVEQRLTRSVRDERLVVRLHSQHQQSRVSCRTTGTSGNEYVLPSPVFPPPTVVSDAPAIQEGTDQALSPWSLFLVDKQDFLQQWRNPRVE